MLILLAFVVPLNVAAQQVTSSFRDLTQLSLVEVGDEIWITCDLRGTGEYKEYEAEVVALTDSSITVNADVSVFGGKEQFILPADRVRQIDGKRISRRKGALIGLAIGGALGIYVALASSSWCGDELAGTGEDECVSGGVVTGVALAGVAAGIGAAIGRGQHVETFTSPGPQMALAPILTRQKKGFLFSVAW